MSEIKLKSPPSIDEIFTGAVHRLRLRHLRAVGGPKALAEYSELKSSGESPEVVLQKIKELFLNLSSRSYLGDYHKTLEVDADSVGSFGCSSVVVDPDF